MPVAIDDASPMLSGAESGYTVSLAFTNLSDAEVELRVLPAIPRTPGCDLTVSPTALPAATRETVTVTVPVACSLAEDGFDFIVEAQSSDGTREFPVSAAPAPSDDPDWLELAGIPVALLAAICIPSLAFFIWPEFKTETPPATGQAGTGGIVSSIWVKLRAPLRYLETTYSFKDSWVSNVTVISGLPTGIFGPSETVKAFLGVDADQAVALSSVGAAVALAFVGAGPIVILALEKGGEDRAPTVSVS